MVIQQIFRKFKGLCLVGVLWACGSEPASQHGLETKATFSIDSVLIDSEGAFLYLNAELRQSTLSADKRFLYNFNERESHIEKINLEELRLEELLIFERDGPNGIGSLISNIQLVGEDIILIWSVNGAGIFNFQGERLTSVDLSPLEKILPNGNHYSLRTYKDNAIELFGLSIYWDSFEYIFWKLDLEKGQLKNYNLSEFDKVKDFRLQQMDGARIVRGYLPSVFLSQDMNKLFLSNEVSNDIYHYDPELDSMVHHTLPFDLLPPEKKSPSSTKAESQDQMNTLLMDYKEDINFSKLVWDEASNLFYRFSYKEKFTGSTERDGSPLASFSEVFLSVWDPELNLLLEQQVEGLTETPKNHFIKDGRIWIYVNVEDEMGFIRLSFDLHDG